MYVHAVRGCGVRCGVLWCVLVAVGRACASAALGRECAPNGSTSHEQLWPGRCKLNYLLDWWESNGRWRRIYTYIDIHTNRLDGMVSVFLASSRRIFCRQSCALWTVDDYLINNGICWKGSWIHSLVIAKVECTVHVRWLCLIYVYINVIVYPFYIIFLFPRWNQVVTGFNFYTFYQVNNSLIISQLW